jgi:ATP/maltotriose-dependent transcriptional regulator MalT
MMRDVARGVVSPVFAGREPELAVLAGAFEAAAGGTPSTVLVGAEAGGGKTRLTTEFAMRVRDRALVVTGGCVELSAADLPYAPFAAVLRELARERGASELAALLPGNAAGELAVLLPGFGAPPTGADRETARVRLFELLLALLEALAEQQPVVMVVEDVHWVDRATCDLLSFLARNLRQAAVLLVVTFRSDELHRNPLLRPLLAGLGRMGGVARLELSRLSRDEVAVQLEGILGHAPASSVANAVFERGSGIPLFTEALVNPDGTITPGLPWLLEDLLLASVKNLPDPTQEVLRAVAVGGARTGHALLATVTGCDDAALTAALRPAVAASVLVTDGGGYAFRHELIREALLKDLLPGERARAHSAFAQALEAAPSLSLHGSAAVQVALHWRSAAAEEERALAAAWRAAASSGEAFAHVQRLQMLEQILDLWSQVPDAARLTGTDHIGVLVLAADTAHWAGEPERGMILVEAALTEVGEVGEAAERRASLLLRRADLRRELLLPGQIDDLRTALALAATPTRIRAQVLAQLGWALRREDHHEEVGQLARELDTLAARLGDEEFQAEAMLLQAAEGAYQREDTAALQTAVEKAAATGNGQLEVRAYLTASQVLEVQGSHELAIQAGREGLARARQLGLGRQAAAPIAGKLAESLTSVGRWDEALEILDEILSLDQPPLGRAHPLLARGLIQLARGDLDTAARTIGELRSLPAGLHAEAQYAFPLARLEIGYRLATGDLVGALSAARALPHHNLRDDPRYPWALLAMAMRVCADAQAVSLPPEAGDPRQLRADLERRAAGASLRSPLHEAHAATFAAEAARARGHRDQEAWDTAAAAWERLGRPYPQAYALLRAADAAVAAGDRDGAASRMRWAAELAGPLAAMPLQQQVGQLARRARIHLTGPGDGEAVAGATVPFGLTARELEVLRLVAAGRGNREIAAELFISPRTASVHVSNILGKLGVASRGEAAASAYRLHLFDVH